MLHQSSQHCAEKYKCSARRKCTEPRSVGTEEKLNGNMFSFNVILNSGKIIL